MLACGGRCGELHLFGLLPQKTFKYRRKPRLRGCDDYEESQLFPTPLILEESPFVHDFEGESLTETLSGFDETELNPKKDIGIQKVKKPLLVWTFR